MRTLLRRRHPPYTRPALQPHFLLPEGQLITRLQLPVAEGGGGGGAGVAGPAAAAEVAGGLETSTAIDPDALFHFTEQAGGAWLQLLGAPFEVPRRCDVWVALTATDSAM